MNQPCRDTFTLQEGADQAGIGSRDAGALEIAHRHRRTAGSCEPEAGSAESETENLVGFSTGIQQHVASGDAQVESSLPHIHRDVTRTQIVELDTIGVVDQHQVFGVVALPVAGFTQDTGRAFGQRALVGHRNLQQLRRHRRVPSAHRYS